MESEAGHHPECSFPFNWCTCTSLYERDNANEFDTYEALANNDAETGWPYDDD